ncbi:TatD family hydrolase [Moritella sp. F3]|uniref:TatD family hydrolase n=1 Tax=Moritella sp. F3 TaxID=2718882 RepID=UPI0018E1B481|nr:TatD family hydrolase [Moritella sp. F3]GIC79454.1 DNase TatD [Moritella sp. F1]GIC84125.1 DNase TatD [Moritella sp. F3]
MKKQELIDIGVNLTNVAFHKDLPDVIARASAQGVRRLIVTGTDIAESQLAYQLTQDYPQQLYATAGIHPHDARHATDESWLQIKTLAQHDSVVAIGECGLDFNRDFSPRPMQEAAFAKQLELAAELNMPVFMHERDANERFIAILKEYRSALPAAVLHCFTGSASDLDACLELDLHIGITGWICDERRGADLYQLVREIPSDRLMLETDAPYLLPRDLKPKPKSRRNEPCHLPHIAETIARARGEDIDTLLSRSLHVTERFFQLPKL